MGSWNATCGVTQLPIRAGTPVALFPLIVKQHDFVARDALTCPTCGTDHDRDVNAARNIRARGLVWLEQQFAEAAEARAEETASNEVPPSQAAPRPGMAVS